MKTNTPARLFSLSLSRGYLTCIFIVRRRMSLVILDNPFKSTFMIRLQLD